MTIATGQPKPRKCQNTECGAKFIPQRLGSGPGCEN